MKIRKTVHLLVASIIFFSLSVFAQEEYIKPDLSKLMDQEIWKIQNREAKIIQDKDQFTVYLAAREGDGIAWYKNIEFTNGIIEVDIMGKDQPGSSFVGIAFRGTDISAYDAIYFRPFNFASGDPLRKGHSVQYISHPNYTWSKLRETHPEEYENPVNADVDPNDFFHAKIVVKKPKISVFINNSKEPCLEVNELADRKGGYIGFWTGNNSEGFFKNLKITPAFH